MKRYNVPVRFEGAVTFYNSKARTLNDRVLGAIATTCAKATTDNPDAPIDMISITEDRLSDEKLQQVLNSATVGGVWTRAGSVEQQDQGQFVPVTFEGTVTIGVPHELTTEDQLQLAMEAAFTQVLGVVDGDAPFHLALDGDVDGVIAGSIIESAAVEGRWRDHERWSVEERQGKTA